MKLSDIAKVLNAQIEGNPDIEINDVGKIETAKHDEITFLSNNLYRKYLSTTNAGAILVQKDFTLDKDSPPVKTVLVRVKEPYQSFLKTLQIFHPQTNNYPKGVHPSAIVNKNIHQKADEVSIGANCFIADEVILGNNVTVMPNSVLLEGAMIGDDTIIYPNVTIHQNCKIGKRCIIHAGTVIGSDGFGQVRNDEGKYEKLPQAGIVVIGDDVEIGSLCSIDRATIGETRIEDGVKLDNQIQIGHNVTVGANTVIVAHVGIAGSTKIGANCIIGGKAGIVGHIEICDGVIITAATNVSKSISEPGIYSGYRAQKQKTELKQQAVLRNLEEMSKRILLIEKQIKE